MFTILFVDVSVVVAAYDADVDADSVLHQQENENEKWDLKMKHIHTLCEQWTLTKDMELMKRIKRIKKT